LIPGGSRRGWGWDSAKGRLKAMSNNSPEHTRRQAQEHYNSNPQTPKASEYAIPDATTREHYNAEIERQRKANS